jgi:hypothetical protein
MSVSRRTAVPNIDSELQGPGALRPEFDLKVWTYAPPIRWLPPQVKALPDLIARKGEGAAAMWGPDGGDLFEQVRDGRRAGDARIRASRSPPCICRSPVYKAAYCIQ